MPASRSESRPPDVSSSSESAPTRTIRSNWTGSATATAAARRDKGRRGVVVAATPIRVAKIPSVLRAALSRGPGCCVCVCVRARAGWLTGPTGAAKGALVQPRGRRPVGGDSDGLRTSQQRQWDATAVGLPTLGGKSMEARRRGSPRTPAVSRRRPAVIVATATTVAGPDGAPRGRCSASDRAPLLEGSSAPHNARAHTIVLCAVAAPRPTRPPFDRTPSLHHN